MRRPRRIRAGSPYHEGSDVISDPEARRTRASGYGLRADELGQQMMMGGITAAASAVIIVLLIVAGFVIAGVLSIVAALIIVALLRLSPFLSHAQLVAHLQERDWSLWAILPTLRDNSVFATVRFGDYFAWQLPGLLLAAGLMAARLRGPFLGPAGYLKSCLTGQVAWPAGFFGIFGIFVALVYVMR